MFASGDVLGKYEIVREIGRGGMGAVYEAVDRTLGRCVALKVLRSELTASREMLERFLAEARAAAAVSHPNVVTLYEVGEFEGTHFIAMELLSDDLGRLIHRSGAMAIDDVRRLGFEIAAGLGAAHRAGLIHRDVKPSNVMLTADGTAKLVDFGIARLGEGVGLTRTGLAMGTPTYMSPEQGTGAAVDHRTDLYSLGIMLFEMLTGRVPYDASTAMGVLYQHAHAPLPDVRSVRPDAPAWLAEVIGRCLAKSPEGRFADADQVARALQTGAAPMAPAPPATMPIAPQPAPRTAQGRGWLVPALVMALVGCIVVAGLLAAQVASSFRPTAPRPAVGGTPAWGTAYEGTPSTSPGTRGAQDLDVPAEPESLDSEPLEEAQTRMSEFILPDSSERRYEEHELEHLTLKELCIARNEIYARHGFIFKSPPLQEHFEATGWYEGRTRYQPRVSKIEELNAGEIKKLEIARNSPYLKTPFNEWQ
jgi:serine/threonine-protein kinase